MNIIIDGDRRMVIPNEFPKIDLKDLQTGDIVLFYYGNKLTAWHGRSRRKELGRSTNPPYHAAIVYLVEGDTAIILDPVAITELQSMSKYMGQSTKRIDIIRYPLTDEQKVTVKNACNEMIKKVKIYDFKGYGAFISQMPYMSWFTFIKPSKKNFYCSDAVTYCLEEKAGVDVSPRDHDFTAPVDLQIQGLINTQRDLCKVYTLKQAEGK